MTAAYPTSEPGNWPNENPDRNVVQVGQGAGRKPDQPVSQQHEGLVRHDDDSGEAGVAIADGTIRQPVQFVRRISHRAGGTARSQAPHRGNSDLSAWRIVCHDGSGAKACIDAQCSAVVTRPSIRTTSTRTR